MSVHARGLFAERLAEAYLRAKGYRVLARRHATPVGELDLVCLKDGVVAFVEVKRRTDEASALGSITAKQRARVARAAQAYLLRHPSLQALDCRFDVVAITPWRMPVHVEGAWEVGW